MKNKILLNVIIALIALITVISFPALTNAAQNEPIAISSEKDFSKIAENPEENFTYQKI